MVVSRIGNFSSGTLEVIVSHLPTTYLAESGPDIVYFISINPER